MILNIFYVFVILLSCIGALGIIILSFKIYKINSSKKLIKPNGILKQDSSLIYSGDLSMWPRRRVSLELTN